MYGLKSFVQIGLAALCLAGMWLHVDRVMVGHQVAEAARLGTPRGNLSDLYPVWYGSRELLLHKRNPYSREVTREIQAGYYGRALDQTRPNDPSNQQGFAYPGYVAFILAASVNLPFAAVRVIFFWLLMALTAGSVLLWLRVVQWKLSCSQLAIAMMLLLGSFPVVQGLKLQQLSLLVAFFIAGSMAALAGGQLVLSGLLLGMAMIKPQLAVPVTVWLICWVAAEWRMRWKFVAGFVGCFAGLVVGAEILLPGWIGKFEGAVVAYRRYAAGGRLLEQMLPVAIAVPALSCLLAGLAFTCWRARKLGAGDPQFVLVTALVLAVTLLIPPMYPPHYQLLLLPGVFLLVQNRRGPNLVFRFLLALAAGLLAWSWMSAVALATASFFTLRVQALWALPLWTTVIFPIPVIAGLGLMAYESSASEQPSLRDCS